ncbi:signal peptide peptidase SppA [Candidatus Palibaumannia cicadellinicola]|nr:signal peptide peptidase SppA [Candidatus Baumannia cicadellinicola]MCJ7462079.1 signal peptide peptidase SppA [Candidatus Baumannia cicadellinicola]
MITLWKIIVNPLIFSWRLLIFFRELIANLFILLLIVVIVNICLHITNTTPSFMKKGALVMDLKGFIVDQSIEKKKLRLFNRNLHNGSNYTIPENSLFDIVNILRQAKNNNHITGLVLLLKNFYGADQPSLQYIGKALHEFRNSGKPIYAVGDNYSQAQYFLASYANKIYLLPQGEVDLHGFATNNLYYKSLLDKLRINSHVFRVGTYKSAAEPFLRDNMSKAARDADSRWTKQLWQNYLNIVATNRNLTPQQLFPNLSTILKKFSAVKGDTAQYALKNKWVDEVLSRSQIDNIMIKAFGFNDQNKSFNSISIYDYHKIYPIQQKNTLHSAQIAVIFVDGTITNEQERPGLVNCDKIAFQIRNACLDPNVKALILRVNSPGGSVNASEIIRAELETTRNANKPIVISMGGMAASGGYWISTPGNIIIASPSTITGSIGIFGIVHTIENLLDYVGIHADGVATSPIAGTSITKKLPAELSTMMQLNVENGYNNFVSLVAQSRNKTISEIEKIAQGHIWIGSDALKKGLVDKLGDFDDAVSQAAKLANLKQYKLNWYIDDVNLISALLTQLNAVFLSILPVPIIKMENFINNTISLFPLDQQNCYALCMTCEPNKLD